MVKINFPQTAGDGRVLNSFVSHLGTGGVQHRLEMLEHIDLEFCEGYGTAILCAGSIDAPEMIPNGQTVRAWGWPSYNVQTRPGAVAR